MARLTFLGSSSAVPTVENRYSQLVLVGEHRSLLIDCGFNPYLRLRRLGLSLDSITDLLVTHFHPDHTAGIPTYFLSSWLAGRTNPMTIHGLSFTVNRIKKFMDLYDWRDWSGFFKLVYNDIPSVPNYRCISSDEFNVITSPVKHAIPAIGIRVEFLKTGTVIAYSGDTEPCQAVSELAQDADILVHEASGEYEFHTSAEQAGEIAESAGVKSLYLIHYPASTAHPQELVNQASNKFSGSVMLAQDMLTLAPL